MKLFSNKISACLALALFCISSLSANEQIEKNQKTFAMIKPGAVKRNEIGAIIQKIESAKLKVIGLRMEKLSKEKLAVFYKEHENRPFFKDLLEIMSGGPVVALCLEGENAVMATRELVGATDPKDAKEGTIRKLFGVSKSENAIHASDSVMSAEREIALFFSDKDIYPQN